MSATPSILIGCFGDTVWVRVVGRGTFQNSGGFKNYARKLMSRGYSHFNVDLHACDLMDSTFMGMLTGLALHLREDGEGSLAVVGANERNAALLSNLGLDQIFTVHRQGDPTAPKLPEEITSQESSAASELPASPAKASEMLEAHRNLVEAAPENAAKFRDVLELLEKETGEAAS